MEILHWCVKVNSTTTSIGLDKPKGGFCLRFGLSGNRMFGWEPEKTGCELRLHDFTVFSISVQTTVLRVTNGTIIN